MSCIITVPKGKNILEFLQELDGTNNRTRNAWIFLHKGLLQELMRQCGFDDMVPALSIVEGNGSFSLNYGPDLRHVGALAFRSEAACDADYRPLWFLLTIVRFDEDSPVKFAFRSPSVYPSEALFLALEE